MVFVAEHERNSKKELHYGKLLHLYCATVACLFSKEIGIMILVRICSKQFFSEKHNNDILSFIS